MVVKYVAISKEETSALVTKVHHKNVTSKNLKPEPILGFSKEEPPSSEIHGLQYKSTMDSLENSLKDRYYKYMLI